MDSKIAGSIAGAVATIPMTAVMTALNRTLPEEQSRPLPPREITENALGGAMEGLNDTQREAVSMTAHLSYGATVGAGYAAVAGQSGLPPVAEGALYGLAIWGGSYLGLMPASGLYKPATEDTAQRNLMLVSAHIVWGAALGWIWSALADRD